MPAKIAVMGIPTDIVRFPSYNQITIETGSAVTPPERAFGRAQRRHLFYLGVAH